MGGHRFGHNRHFFHILMPVFRITKHFRRMDITDHIVDIPVIHNDLEIRILKTAFQFVQRSSPGSTATTSVRGTIQSYFMFREIKGRLKDFHFRIQFFFIFSIIDATLHEIVQVDFSKSLSEASLLTFIPNIRRKTRQTGR